MRIFFTILFLFLFCAVFGQKVDDLDKYRMDTLLIEGISVKKVIVFENEALQFFLNYDAFKDSALLFAKAFRRADKSQVGKVARLIKSAKRQLGSGDTAWMKANDYNFIGFHFIEKFVASQIDNRTIAIKLVNGNEPVSKVIRVTGRFIKGPLNAWGGKRYYRLGQNRHFALVTTSQS